MTYSGQEGRGGRGGLVQQREALSRLPALLLAHRVHRLAHPPPVSISIILGTTGLKSHKLYVSHLHFMIKTYKILALWQFFLLILIADACMLPSVVSSSLQLHAL